MTDDSPHPGWKRMRPGDHTFPFDGLLPQPRYYAVVRIHEDRVTCPPGYHSRGMLDESEVDRTRLMVEYPDHRTTVILHNWDTDDAWVAPETPARFPE